MVGDTTLKAVMLASGTGALGTWRSPVGQRRESEEPTFSDESAGKPVLRGAYASQRLSFLIIGKTCRGKPGSEPYSAIRLYVIVGGAAETWTHVARATVLSRLPTS